MGKMYKWHLPSRDVLNDMFNSHKKIGGFVGLNYWSSSEHYDSNAWLQSFGDSHRGNGDKNYVLRVRAVRALESDETVTRRVFISGRKKYQAYEKDAPDGLTWDKAMEYCANLSKMNTDDLLAEVLDEWISDLEAEDIYRLPKLLQKMKDFRINHFS